MTPAPAPLDPGLLISPAQMADRRAFLLKNDRVLRGLVRLKYFSWEVEGAEHLPRQGPVVYAMNHAGWFALDTIMVACSVARTVGVERAPYFAAVDSSLTAPVVGPFLRRVGGIPASLFRHPKRLPPEIQAYGMCPEGVEGNTKPFWEAYRMHPWGRGFVRVAMALQAPIVPVAVFGGEESFPVAWTVRMLEPIFGSVVGLPVAAVPLPARWKIVFHPPVVVTEPGGRTRRSPQYCDDLATRMQEVVQATLDREIERQPRPLARLSSLVHSAGAHLRKVRGRGAAEPLSLNPDPLLAPLDAAGGPRPG